MSSVFTYITYITEAPTTAEAPPTQTTLDAGNFMFRKLSERFEQFSSKKFKAIH